MLVLLGRVVVAWSKIEMPNNDSPLLRFLDSPAAITCSNCY